MRKLKLRKGFWILMPALLLAFFASPVNADSYTASGATDFFFEFEQQSQFTVRTYAQQYGIDSMIWLYDSNNQIITANDDYYGLDSYISSILQPGIYRLRTGVCCGNPDAWYGSSYTFETNVNGNVVSSTTTIVENTTTTIVPYLNPPQNLTITSVNESKVYLSWELPEQSNIEVERYAVYWSCDNWENGFAISSITNTAIIENLDSGQSCQFKVRADNDSYEVYSSWSNEVFGVTDQTTTTLAPTTTTIAPTTTIPSTTTNPPTTTTSVVTTTTSTTSTTTTVFTPPQATVLRTTTTSSSTTVPIATTIPTTTTTPIPTTVITTTTTTLPINENVDEDVLNVVNNLNDLNETAIVNIINEIINNDISNEEAVLLSTNSKILDSISTEQAGEIFKQISVSELTLEEEKALVKAISDAPDEIKNEFEKEIDIFSEGLDDYVPKGSAVDVGARRAIIAVTTVASSITMTAPSTGAPSSSSGGSGTSTDRSSSRSRRK